MDKCPCCERECKDIRDFPEILLQAVSVIKPKDVPAVVSIKHEKENLSSRIKDLLEKNPALKNYFNGLETFTHEYIRPAQVMPKWYSRGEAIPGAEGFHLLLLDSDEVIEHGPSEKRRVSEILLFAENAGRIPHQVLKLGQMEYVGVFPGYAKAEK